MSKRCEEGDHLLTMAEIEPLTVEDIMNCPLLKFIHSVTNDRGHAGTRKSHCELGTSFVPKCQVGR